MLGREAGEDRETTLERLRVAWFAETGKRPRGLLVNLLSWEQFEINQRLLAANAQAHGSQRAAGPAREAPPCCKDSPSADAAADG
jgi:hypothetical protein